MRLISTLLIICMISNPVYARSSSTNRFICFVTFGQHKKSCRKGFDDSFENIVKQTTVHAMETGPKEAIEDLKKAFSKRKVFEALNPSAPLNDGDGAIYEILPDSIHLQFKIAGSGVRAKYTSKENVKEIARILIKNNGKFDENLIYRLFPDELRIVVGAELAFVLTAMVETTLYFETDAKIKKVISLIKHR